MSKPTTHGLSDLDLFILRVKAMKNSVGELLVTDQTSGQVRPILLFDRIIDVANGLAASLQGRTCLRHACEQLFFGEEAELLQGVFEAPAASWEATIKERAWAEIGPEVEAVQQAAPQILEQPARIREIIDRATDSRFSADIARVSRWATYGHLKSMAAMAKLAVECMSDLPELAEPCQELAEILQSALALPDEACISDAIDPGLIFREPRYAPLAKVVEYLRSGSMAKPAPPAPASEISALEITTHLQPDLAEDFLGIFGAEQVVVNATTVVPSYVEPNDQFQSDRANQLLAVLKSCGASGSQELLRALGFTEVKVVATFLTVTKNEDC